METEGLTWNSKQGWTVPMHVFDSVPMGLWCQTTVGGQQHQSTSYLLHITGEAVSHTHTHTHARAIRPASGTGLNVPLL